MITGEKILVTGASGNVGDPSRRRSITGPCKHAFAEAYSAIHAHRHGNKDR